MRITIDTDNKELIVHSATVEEFKAVMLDPEYEEFTIKSEAVAPKLQFFKAPEYPTYPKLPWEVTCTTDG